MARPVTREEKENSKREFDEMNILINKELKSLENWVLKTAQPNSSTYKNSSDLI